MSDAICHTSDSAVYQDLGKKVFQSLRSLSPHGTKLKEQPQFLQGVQEVGEKHNPHSVWSMAGELRISVTAERCICINSIVLPE